MGKIISHSLCVDDMHAEMGWFVAIDTTRRVIMEENTVQKSSTFTLQKLYIAPSMRIYGQPEIPSSKYYTLRYILAATLAAGESHIKYPAESDDSDALFRGCRAFGAELTWQDDQHRLLRVQGLGH